MLVYDEDTLERTRRLIEAEPAMRRGWAVYAAGMAARDADWLATARERVDTLRQRWRTHGGSKRFTLGNEVRQLAKEAQNLAFYARMTGSAQVEALVRGLIALIGEEESWTYQSGGGRQSDLWTADIGTYLSSAYEAVRASCAPEERERIEAALYIKAYLPLYGDWLHPADKIHALDTMGHNWWIVCVSAAGLLLLTLQHRVPHAEEALHTIAEGVREWFAYPGSVLQNKPPNFGPDGDYAETMGYLDYALGNFFVFEAAYRRRTGDSSLGQLPVLDKLPDVYLETIYAAADGGIGTFHFGDEGDRSKHAYVWLRLADLQRRGELLGLFAALKGDPSEAAEFAFYPEGLETLAPLSAGAESVAVFAHSGTAFVRWRSGMQQIVLAVRSGESWNHNHLDAGTFILTIDGQAFVDDSGHCAYSKPLYNQYYRQSAAHNVVLFEGAGQPPALIEEGTKFPGSIPDWIDLPGYKYVLADCAGPYSGLYRRFYRHFLCLDGAMVLVDDLHAERGGLFEGLLHLPEGLKIESGTAEPILSSTDGQRELHVMHPYPVHKQYVREKGYRNGYARGSGPEDVFPEADYVKIRSASADGRIKFVGVFLLPLADGGRLEVNRLADGVDGTEDPEERVNAGNPGNSKDPENPALSSGQSPDMQGLVLKSPEGGRIEIYVNNRADGRVMHDNAHAAFGALSTDALLSTLSYDAAGRLQRVSLHNGSYLKLGGRCLFSSLSKAAAVIDYRGGLSAHTSLAGEAWCHFALEAPAADVGAAAHAADESEGEQAAATDASEGAGSAEARAAGLRREACSGLWKRQMASGRSGFRLAFNRPVQPGVSPGESGRTGSDSHAHSEEREGLR
ncbi:heparinase II/III domain-containing protein [Saccharibacillus brassicae]|uniref:Heparinase II/III-like C-terminal domain-containing protein n=1 Tax=Saccharibacillus brassicae TaxID=2583377 RepID=A0A4Y6V5I6_SACBS|nr:heparinase II/III family protein [Saccharibacillus brassicae]QDH23555.1 hypothetical protein FFV09_23425 [Saccharibacillus brassicae]